MDLKIKKLGGYMIKESDWGIVWCMLAAFLLGFGIGGMVVRTIG
jgi:hypothetical protein